MKNLFKELSQKYSKIDDNFLSLFEKRSIFFIEDGTDLKGEIANSSVGGNPFERSFANNEKDLYGKQNTKIDDYPPSILS